MLAKYYSRQGRRRRSSTISPIIRRPPTTSPASWRATSLQMIRRRPRSRRSRRRSTKPWRSRLRREDDHRHAGSTGPTPQKFKTPEVLVSVARAKRCGAPAMAARAASPSARMCWRHYQALAQQPFSAPSPAGWPDDTAAWSGSDAVMKRLEWANDVSRRISRGMSQPVADLSGADKGHESAERRQSMTNQRRQSPHAAFISATLSPNFRPAGTATRSLS